MEKAMKKIALALKTLVLTAALAGLAHAGAPAAERVNINSADAATLDRVLVGVGPSKAEAIVAYRKANGAFRSAEQLASVKGIGLATIERNRDRIVVAGGGAAAPAKAAPGKPAAPARPAAAKR
jgi:competence protein ComEA